MLTSPTSAGTPAKAAGLVALACLALLLAACGGDGPDAAGRIAFTDCRTVGTVEQVCDIYTMNADGSGKTQLTHDDEDAQLAAISPDGERMVFHVIGTDAHTDLYVMNADGTGRTRITPDGGGYVDSWSPDGTQIAFSADQADIHVMNADGSGVRQLTDDLGIDHDVAWSPDGALIAFTSDRDGSFEVYVMNADGSGKTPLTDTAGTTNSWAPEWSPDGARIAFLSDRDGHMETYVMNADGTGQTRLTTHANDTGSNYFGAWSPDGTQIVYQSCADTNAEYPLCEIHVMNSDGSGQAQLTDRGGTSRSPAWSPDGKWITFNFADDVYIMAADGSGETQLTDTGAGPALWFPSP